jgi:hypothetical protein
MASWGKKASKDTRNREPFTREQRKEKLPVLAK